MTKKSKIIVFVVTMIITSGILFATIGKHRHQRMMEFRKEYMADSTQGGKMKMNCHPYKPNH